MQERPEHSTSLRQGVSCIHPKAAAFLQVMDISALLTEVDNIVPLTRSVVDQVGQVGKEKDSMNRCVGI